MRRGLHGKPGYFSRQAARLPPGASATCGLPDLLLLAGGASALAIIPGAGCFRALDRVRLVRELRQPAEDPRILSSDRDHVLLLVARRVLLARHWPAARRDGEPQHRGRADLSHLP